MLEMKGLLTAHMESFTQKIMPLTNAVQSLHSLEERMGRMEREWNVKRTHSSPDANLKEETPAQDRELSKYPDPPSAGTVAQQQREPDFPHPSPSTPEMQTSDVAEDLEQPEEAGDPVKPGPSSIPVNHTTGAAKLLLVGPIAELAAAANPYKNKDPPISFDKYPMQEEMKRGLLRVYGRGQGLDRPPGYEKDTLIDHAVEGTPSDTTSDPPTPPPGEEWGQVGGLTPPPEDTPISRLGIESQIGLGVNSEGLPDMSPDIVRRLVASYMSNMNNMHPILVRSRLDSLVEVFLKTVPQESHPKRKKHSLESVSAGFIGAPVVESPGAKRKRSPTVMSESYEPQSIWHKPGHPFRSISTALVLLVLALGSICMHKERIPELVSDKEAEDWENSSQASRNGHPRSPLQTHSSVPDVTGLPSPQDADRMQPPSRRISVDTPPARPGRGNRLRNLDVIPGLSYFALASDIIGNQVGGNSLQHVHVNILAGLYHGQLGRVLESHAYIASACRSLQVILNP
jgi:hypothetical protein